MKVNHDEIMKILESAKGNISWREYARRIGISSSLFYRIKKHTYNPGVKTLMRFCSIKPLEERNNMLVELLNVSGIFYGGWINVT